MFGRPIHDAAPFSPEYTEWVNAFFVFISGRPYDFTNEGMSFDEFDGLVHPLAVLPLDETINKIKTQIDFLSLLRPEKGQRVLEMGCGWGTMAAMFEFCGCDYNAVEASNAFVEVTRKRLFSDKLKGQVHHNHFYSISEMPGLFDLILFEASFHHCRDLGQMLQILHKKITLGGRIIFLYEPVVDQYVWPWGLNITGEGLLQIRGRGWFELVFREDFFLELLRRNNWMIQRSLVLSDSSILYEVIRIEELA